MTARVLPVRPEEWTRDELVQGIKERDARIDTMLDQLAKRAEALDAAGIDNTFLPPIGAGMWNALAASEDASAQHNEDYR